MWHRGTGERHFVLKLLERVLGAVLLELRMAFMVLMSLFGTCTNLHFLHVVLE